MLVYTITELYSHQLKLSHQGGEQKVKNQSDALLYYSYNFLGTSTYTIIIYLITY